MKAIAFLSLVACVSLHAESSRQWLDAYYAVFNAFEAEREEFILSKDSSLSGAIEGGRSYHRAEEALYRYLFVYYIGHEKGTPTWDGGNWTLSIAVCNCGEHGSVPTEEFKALFAERSKALVAYEENLTDGVAERFRAIRHSLPADWQDRRRAALSALKSGFEALVPPDLEGSSDLPPPEFVPPTIDKDEAAEPGATDNPDGA